MAHRTSLGVCYYPEHWPKTCWADDAAAMADMGITHVRIAEFAWALMEPEPGRYDWEWLDDAADIFTAAGLKLILGTPTATPPKWLIDAHPDILAYDVEGRPRRFGSRRHYCFSSPTYRRETARIVTAMAQRYGRHEGVVAWQTDNEYGCHGTTRSFSPAAEEAFRIWLAAKYGTIAALNQAWGTLFWSQIYGDFGQVDLPHLTVTEANPSHLLDFYRFSSDQVVSYNRLQVEILRDHSPGRDILHNFMGYTTDFDHFAVGADIDVAAWDSYPLGFLDSDFHHQAEQRRYMRQGHPDFAAFHHDLYRACGRGRWAVMEQQPGPVNWAKHNPAPLGGMVRLWLQEAAAHGAEFASIFRWRQAPFAQEQMHAGLQRPDGSAVPALEECRQTAQEWAGLAPIGQKQAPAALVFSYEAHWMFEIQPQGRAWHYLRLCFDFYSALRALGVDVDIVPPGASVSGYRLVLIPSLPYFDAQTADALAATDAQILIGPRTGSKTRDFHIPAQMTDPALQALIPITLTHSESFPPHHRETVNWDGQSFHAGIWLDHVKTDLAPLAVTDAGTGILFRHRNVWSLTSLLLEDGLTMLIRRLCEAAKVPILDLPEGLRLRHTDKGIFAFNYNNAPVQIPASAVAEAGPFVLGGDDVPPGGLAHWRTDKG